MEVQRKQNLRHGLTNITDGCVHFFLELDKQIRGLETLQNLNLYTSKIYAFISEEISDSDLIREQWRNLFTNVPFDENFSMISALFDEVLAKYLRMSSNQFMRECNQNFAADKEKAQRKQVLQKKVELRVLRIGQFRSVSRTNLIKKSQHIATSKVC